MASSLSLAIASIRAKTQPQQQTKSTSKALLERKPSKRRRQTCDMTKVLTPLLLLIVLSIYGSPSSSSSLDQTKHNQPSVLDPLMRSEAQIDWSSQLGEAEEQKLGVKVDKSLIDFDLTQSNDPEPRKMHRLLVRQLTGLIMNSPPEIIAQNMEGTKVSGQMVSGSSDFDRHSDTSENFSDVGRAAFVINGPDTTHIDLSSSEGNSNGQDQQLDMNSSSNSEDNTCAPDYEDQTIMESSGNLTSEQQQQLLDASLGLLTPNSNGTNIELAQQTQRPPIQCVNPNSKTIGYITRTIAPICFGAIILVGLLGNVIVMLVILEDRKTERELTPTNLLILDLSFADLSFILFCIPFTGWDYVVGHWVFGLLWCKINQYLIVVCALSSIYTLVLMSLDRFMAIVFPIECISYRTSKNTLYAIYIKWVIILIIAVPTISMHGLIDLPSGPDQLYTCRFLADLYNPLHFQIIFFITSYLFPLILIFFLYLKLLKKLWFGSKPFGHKESQKMLESKKRVTWLVASIVIVFALCWCPIQVMLILMRLKYNRITVTYIALQVAAHTLGYMNSCINPIVYAFCSETFHNSFRRSVFGRLFCITPINSHDSDRSAPGRNTIINHSTSLLNNNNNNQHQHHHNQHQLDHVVVSNNSSSGNTKNSTICNEGDVGSTRVLISPYSNINNNISKIVTLPLEPRDRDSLPSASTSQPILVNNSSGQFENGLSHMDSDKTVSVDNLDRKTTTKKPTKQQLVARVVQSGNQISHQCEPCYQ